ncbi:MAG: beta-ketoacyl-ACP synthase II [Rickettsiales bacterium]|jgi:3-oxoacyl-[acyl-carrier-protein] synthase II|nr:beta-ketoacyl-ACP synthase II [Rickettsiales bacterium]
MSERRVVITGMGIVSPVGCGVEFAWKNILAGKSGIRKIDMVDLSDLPSQIGGQIPRGTAPGELNMDDFLDAREQRRMDNSLQYAIAAADMAIKDAFGVFDGEIGDSKLEIGDDTSIQSRISNLVNPERIGVSIGGGIGGIQTIYDNCVALDRDGPRHISPFFITSALINMAAGNVSIRYGLKGPNLCVVTACATGNHAIGEAARIIAHGDADIMVAGGTEAPLTRICYAGFAAMRALSTRNDDPAVASRPWDTGRDGFVAAEGAGILVLEEYEHARARGAKIYAEVAGYGMSGDAYHIAAPATDGDGAMRAMRAAIDDAGVTPGDIDYINAHGTSTGAGDMAELNAVRTLFGQEPGTRNQEPVSMSSTKSMTGHLLGAAGAIEAIFTALAIRDGIVPPTINLENPEPDSAGIDLVPNTAKKRNVNVALSNSFGFGGTNATILLRKI